MGGGGDCPNTPRLALLLLTRHCICLSLLCADRVLAVVGSLLLLHQRIQIRSHLKMHRIRKLITQSIILHGGESIYILNELCTDQQTEREHENGEAGARLGGPSRSLSECCLQLPQLRHHRLILSGEQLDLLLQLLVLLTAVGHTVLQLFDVVLQIE